MRQGRKPDTNFLSSLCLLFQLSDLSAVETRSEFETQKQLISDLQQRLDDAELKLIEGEKLRKKLHNTILVKLETEKAQFAQYLRIA